MHFLTTTAVANRRVPAMAVPKLARGASKLKSMPPVRTRTMALAFMCFSTTVSLLVLSPRLDQVPPSAATWRESFMTGSSPKQLRSSKEVDITTELCFLTSVYGSSAETSDRPPDVTELQRKSFPESKFFLFTNINDLECPGWIKITRKFEFKRFITMSRWPKFMAWKEPIIQSCRVVFYMDGYVTPNPKNKKDILRSAQAITESDVGMAQNPASKKKRLDNHTLMDELKYIIRTEKDIFPNINVTAKWLRSQPDYEDRNQCQVYDNCLIGYNPRSPHFQQATTEFWNLYSSEEYTWRDQPFWCFVLNKLGLTPLLLGGSRHDFFTVHRMSKAPGKHKYDETHENSAFEAPRQPEPERKEPHWQKQKRKKKLEKLSNELDIWL